MPATPANRTMTDPELVDNKLSLIEARVRELRELARPDLIDQDVREERFVAHTLQLAIQAALDVASHIVSDENLGEPNTNRELFDLIGKDGWLPRQLVETMESIVGLRTSWCAAIKRLI
jgi:uncharacterized protein YutE (UPF0331/DUF86 family)